MGKVLKQLMTGSDNITHDLYRYMALGVIVVFIALEIYSVLQGTPFDAQSFGIGAGSTLGGVGLALGVQSAADSIKG